MKALNMDLVHNSPSLPLSAESSFIPDSKNNFRKNALFGLTGSTVRYVSILSWFSFSSAKLRLKSLYTGVLASGNDERSISDLSRSCNSSNKEAKKNNI